MEPVLNFRHPRPPFNELPDCSEVLLLPSFKALRVMNNKPRVLLGGDLIVDIGDTSSVPGYVLERKSERRKERYYIVRAHGKVNAECSVDER